MTYSNEELLDLYALYKQAIGKHRILFKIFLEFQEIQLSTFYHLSYLSKCPHLIVGDCNIDQPGITELKAKAKYDAWNAKKGVSQDEAKSQYVELANKMIEKHGTS